MSISSKYNPAEIESRWYQHWESKGYFRSTPDEREPFTIVIPPPNVTGVLHMGHMLNNTIQDVLIRRARLKGKNACWVPGTDHASIATEAKVVRMLREKGIKKSDLSRDEFLEHAWKWKEEYGGIILKQLRKLGATCDWERTAFTMDEVRSEAVIKAFVDLFNKGLLYRKKRMVNWDPQAQTVLSNEEVIHHNENANLYHVSYQIKDSEDTIVIATTRPETILGDSAIAVHPDDPRYAHLKGRKAIVPLVNREVPIIFDTYVEMEFGTGALKVTPAHDVNDYDIGERHDLQVIDVLTADGKMSEAAQHFIGEDRDEARVSMIKWLKANDQLVKIEQLSHNVGRSERTNAVVEPRLSLQWYVDMKKLSGKALDAVLDDEVEFFPKKQKNIYQHWMTNIRDWCISRQLWWGHRIPAWYVGDHTIVAYTEDEALQKAQKVTGNQNLTIDDLSQDEDVLDTWFSSWLWPISVFDGFNNREELNYYYPTSVLVTGWDIIFLWVARMIMAGYEWEGKKPFDKVYFTGMVRDKKRRKMSKSLGNSPDALKLIEKFGADGVRFGMLSCSPAGGDLLFDEKLCLQGSKFSNKIWNALKLIKGWESDPNLEIAPEATFAYEAISEQFDSLLRQLEDNYEQFRLSESLIALYSFIWNDYCSWYLELIKSTEGKIHPETMKQAIGLFEKISIVLHPYMPFITEEIYHQLNPERDSDCIIASYPNVGSPNDKLQRAYQALKNMTTGIREVRNKHGIKATEPLDVRLDETKLSRQWMDIPGFVEGVSKLADLKSFELTSTPVEDSVSFICDTEKVHVIMDVQIDPLEELQRLEEELKYAQGFLASVDKKLSNSRFVDNAPEKVVETERKKQADGQERVKILTKSISELKDQLD